jgi:hypothetical protein
VTAAREVLNRSYPLRSCLENFAQPVDLRGPDQVYCGKCKTHTDHKQTLEMWRNPLVLVVHLKRFQHMGWGSRKLNNLIEFPVTGLDLKAYCAAQSLAANNSADDAARAAGGKPGGCVPGGETGGSVHPDGCDEKAVVNGEHCDAHGGGREDGNGVLGGGDGLHDYSRSVGIQADGNGAGQHVLYDLYSVVNHAGTLGAGHYYSYVKHQEEDKWFCFDDSRVNEMSVKDVVSPNAYLLFYVRRDAPSADVFPSTPLSQQEYQAKVRELEEQIDPTTATASPGVTWRKRCGVM